MANPPALSRVNGCNIVVRGDLRLLACRLCLSQYSIVRALFKIINSNRLLCLYHHQNIAVACHGHRIALRPSCRVLRFS